MTNSEEMSLDVFAAWLSRGVKREYVVYYSGIGIVNSENGIRSGIGTAAFRAERKGLVTLTQRRVRWPGEGSLYGSFEYIATRI